MVQDLAQDSVYILDAYYALYVWIGANIVSEEAPAVSPGKLKDMASQSKSMSAGGAEIRLAVDTAIRYADYIETRQGGRLNRGKAFVVQSGGEPACFKSQFLYWSMPPHESKWPSGIPVDEAWRLIEEVRYSVEQLRAFSDDRDNLPFGLDVERLEHYLSDEEFASVFGMERAAFQGLAKWKRTELKRKVGLF